MGQTEIIIFIILSSLIVLIFVTGIMVFIFQYRKRRLLHEKEKEAIEKQHRLDLLNAQLQAQDQTMQFIGREIHDSVAQKLTLSSIYTQKLEYENEFPAITGRLKNISAVINDALVELRNLSKTLTDNKMHDASLPDLLASECERVNDTGLCRAELTADFNKEISVTVKSFLLRVVQEFIQNSLKHSGGQLILVTLKDSGDGLLLTVSDDGKGFHHHDSLAGGMGLANMERRVTMIGGNFTLQSEPGLGTLIRVIIPGINLMSK